jgi:hypothetical protein
MAHPPKVCADHMGRAAETLKSILASLAEGATTAEILADSPTLSEEDVRAAIAFVAGSAQEDMPLIETPIRQ